MAIARHPSIAALMAKAVDMGYHRSLAIELYKYLSLRLHSPATVELSPSIIVDELWHWLLVNTELAESVYTLLGGRVHHSTSSSNDRCSSKTLRRMRAMNMLELDGHPPNVSFWAEGGLVPCKIAVADGNGAFIHAFRVVSSDKILARDGNVNLVATIAAEMGYKVDDPDDGENAIKINLAKINVVWLTKKRVPVSIPLHCTVRELKQAVLDHEGIPPDQQTIIFGGKACADAIVLGDAGIVDGSDVTLVIHMSGC